MMNSPLVSVLINCYNGEEFLREAIDSVFEQTYENWEIVFWDNCSTDNSAEIAKSYGEKVRYFKGEENIPLYAARALAIKEIKGEYLGILDVDDIWLPRKLEKQLKVFEDEKVGIVCSDSYFFNSKGITKKFFDDRPYFEGMCFEKLMTDYFISLETILLRTKALSELDYIFDSRFNMIGDADLFRRISLNWEVRVIKEPLAKWRIHENSLSWKMPERFAEETLLMLETYRKDIPDFEDKYSEAYRKTKSDAIIGKAKALIFSSEKSKARDLLRPYLDLQKPKLLYYSTFMPSFIVRNAYKFYLRYSGV